MIESVKGDPVLPCADPYDFPASGCGRACLHDSLFWGAYMRLRGSGKSPDEIMNQSDSQSKDQAGHTADITRVAQRHMFCLTERTRRPRDVFHNPFGLNGCSSLRRWGKYK